MIMAMLVLIVVFIFCAIASVLFYFVFYRDIYGPLMKIREMKRDGDMWVAVVDVIKIAKKINKAYYVTHSYMSYFRVCNKNLIVRRREVNKNGSGKKKDMNKTNQKRFTLTSEERKFIES